MSILHITTLLLLLFFPAIGIGDELLPGISITASRSPMHTNHTPNAVTVISRQEIDRRNATYVSEVLQSVAGLNITTQGNPGSLTQVRIRGSEANQVLVLIDGIEVNDPAAGSEFNFAQLPAYNIERIEIVRGSQSALWGSDALAGVINITTVGGARKDNQVAVAAHHGANRFSQGYLNFSTSTDKVNFSASGSLTDSKGFNISNSGSERDGYRNSSFNTKTAFQPNSQITAGFSAHYTNASNDFDPAPFGVPLDGLGRNNTNQLYTRGYIKITSFEGRWRHMLESSLLKTRNGSNDPLFGISKTASTKEKHAFQTTMEFKMFNTSAREQSVTMAFEREQERFNQQGVAFPGFDPNQRQKITSLAKIVEYKAALSDNWSLSAALRDDDNDEFRDHQTYKVGISYFQPWSHTKIYATHATGVKNPTFTEIFGFAPNNFLGNPELESETSESFEIGFSQQLFNGKLTIDSALFWEDLQDEIQTIFLPTLESTTVNSENRSEREGLELSFNARLTDDLTMHGSYTYLKARQPDQTGSTESEIRRPRHQWSNQINYNFSQNRAHLNISIDYIGKRRDLDFSNGTRVTLDDYMLIDLNTRYRLNNRVDIYARIHNLLDESYQDAFGFESRDFSVYTGFKVNI